MPKPSHSAFSQRRRSGRRFRSQAGFTLVEVMMAFVILVAGICGGLTALQSGYKAIDTARCSTLAAQIMQSQIERLRLENWESIKGKEGSAPVTVTELVPPEASDIAGRFTLTQTIQPTTESGVPRTGMYDVTLKVTWTGHGNIPHTRTFVTRYAQNGLYDYYFSRR